jgi:hypothetical protein
MLLLAFSPSFLPTASWAATLLVPDDFPSIGAAIGASTPGDSVLIRPKRYVEYLVISHDLTLVGLGAGALLEGDLNHPQDANMVRVHSPARVHLSNLTVRYGAGLFGGGILANGNSELHLKQVTIEGNGGACESGYVGTGGVSASRLFALDCTFEGNSGARGGAGALSFGDGEVRECIFSHNSSLGHPICGGGPGAVLAGTGSFEDCHFTGNFGEGASAILGLGDLTLRRCVFEEHWGAGDIPNTVVLCYGKANVIEHCQFVKNHYQVALIEGASGSVTVHDSEFLRNDGFQLPLVKGHVDIARSVFAGNTGDVAVECWGNSLIESCTFADGISLISGGIRALQGSPTVRRSIFSHARGTAAIHCGPGVTGQIDCNVFWENDANYEGCGAGPNDFSADPRLCRPEASDYRLRTDSPCLPPNSPSACGLIGALDVGCAPIGIAEGPVGVPAPRLWPAVPSPVRTSARIPFDLSVPSSITLRIYDPQGRAVRTLAEGPFPGGRHTIDWDARDARGRPVAAGAYVLRLEGAGFVRSSKLIVLHQ